jgi:hypothetical protein
MTRAFTVLVALVATLGSITAAPTRNSHVLAPRAEAPAASVPDPALVEVYRKTPKLSAFMTDNWRPAREQEQDGEPQDKPRYTYLAGPHGTDYLDIKQSELVMAAVALVAAVWGTRIY